MCPSWSPSPHRTTCIGVHRWTQTKCSVANRASRTFPTGTQTSVRFHMVGSLGEIKEHINMETWTTCNTFCRRYFRRHCVKKSISSQILQYNKSTLTQVRAWCPKTTCYYMYLFRALVLTKIHRTHWVNSRVIPNNDCVVPSKVCEKVINVCDTNCRINDFYFHAVSMIIAIGGVV